MAQATPPKPKLSTPESFVCGAVASCMAVTCTNPMELCKTRLQLQGELAKDAPRVYRNVGDVFVKTWRNEGLRGLQRGLGPGYIYQTFLNGCRLGFYEPVRQQLNRLVGRDPHSTSALTSVAAGVVSGACGAASGNPFYLVKARMQAYSPILPVGTQHNYKNGFDALRTIFRAEGVRGFVRGVDAAILRTCMGSSVQLPTYIAAKNYFASQGWLPADSVANFLVSSSISGACVCLMMQPPDTALTRVYNQPLKTLPDGRKVGALYKNPIDCLWKTLKAEGPGGWYKGTTAQFLRIAPHTILCLVLNDVIVGWYSSIKG